MTQSNDSPTPPPSTIVFGKTSGAQDIAQSFQVGQSGTPGKLSLYLEKVGNPGNLTVHITGDANGSPASTDIVSASLSASLVTSSFGWVDALFSSTVPLQPGVTYWYVLDGGSNSNNYYVAGANSSFSGGQAKLGKYGGSWSSTSPAGLDAYFRLYFGGFTSAIGGATSPSGIIIGQSGQGIAWSHTVTGATVAGSLYCQVGNYNNKACDASRPDPSPMPMPISDGNIQDWETQAAAGGTITGDVNVGSSGMTLGPKKITGNLYVGGGGTLTQAGTLWVLGNVSFDGGGKLKLASSYGTASGVLVANGTVSIGGGASLTGSGQSGSYPMILSTSSCPYASSCGGESNGNAIALSGGASSVILVAENGALSIEGGSNIKEATAYQITATGGATLTYDSGIANMLFTNGPSGGYTIGSWKEQAP